MIDPPTSMIPELQRQHRMGVPPRYRLCTLEGYYPKTPSQTAAKEAVTRLVATVLRGGSASIALMGEPGVGKSHLCAAAANAVSEGLYEAWLPLATEARRDHDQRMERWRERGSLVNDRPRMTMTEPAYPQWINVPDLTAALKDQFRDRDPDEPRMRVNVEGLRAHRGLLVLDDLGRERISEWTGETIYRLINHRYERFLPTIATTNMDAKALAEAGYWPAISRLSSDGGVFAVEGPDGRPS